MLTSHVPPHRFAAVLLVLAVGSWHQKAQATPITDRASFGSNAVLIDFSDPTLPELATVADEYASLGVSFTAGEWFYSPLGPLGGLDETHVGNFVTLNNSGVCSGEVSFSFVAPVEAAAFSAVTAPGTLEVTALLGGEVIETNTFLTGFTQDYVVGFRNSATFDEVRIRASGIFNDCISLDNLQYEGDLGPAPLVDARGPYLANEGNPLRLVANGRGRNLTYAWDLDEDGEFDDASGRAPLYTPADGPDTRTISVRATDEFGRFAVDEATLTVRNLSPIIQRTTVAPSLPLESQTVTLSVDAIDPAGAADTLTYTWSFGDGSPDAEGATVNHTYRDDGAYTARILIDDGDGGIVTRSLRVNVLNQRPTLAPIQGPISLHEGEEATWTSALTKALQDNVSWAFTWGDSSPTQNGTLGSNVATASLGGTHTYAEDGTYRLFARAFDDDGTSASQFLTVTVRNLPPAITNMRVEPASGDEGEAFSFAATVADPGGPNDPLTLNWDFGDNSAPSNVVNPTHVYTRAGTYTVTLRASDDDGGTTTEQIQVRVGNTAPSIAALEGPEAGNEGQSLRFSGQAEDASGDALTWTWDFGDGTPPQTGEDLTSVDHVWRNNGTYTLTLTVTDAFGGQDQRTSTVTIANVAPRIAEVVIPETLLEGTPADLTASAFDPGQDNLRWSWNFGDNTSGTGREVSHAWPDDNSYFVEVTVTDEDGDSDSRTVQVAVANLPPQVLSLVGDFTGLPREDLSFTSAVVDPGDDTLTWSWSWGDGSDPDVFNNQPSNTHAYTNEGLYTLTLTVSDEDGGETTVTRTVHVGENPLVLTDLQGPSAGNEGEPLSFTGILSGAAPGDATWIWDFGDDTPPQSGNGLSSISHTWADDGVYPLTLTVTQDGQEVSFSTEIIVRNVAPSLTDVFAPDATVEGVTFTAAASATDLAADNDPLTWTWNFGDGSAPQNTQTASHAYANEGLYTITLTVADDDGGQTTRQFEVEVDNAPPTISAFSVPNSADEGQRLVFRSTTSDQGPNDELSYTWVFSDGTEPQRGDNLEVVTHTFADDGAFTVRLLLSDGEDLTIARQTVRVRNLPPVISEIGGDTSGRERGTFTFEASASDPGVRDELTYTWSFGDGSPEEQGRDLTEIAHVYQREGTYTLTLTVSDNDGGSASAPLVVQVGNEAPTITRLEGEVEGIEGQGLSFRADATDSGDDLLLYTWNFGDGSPEQSGTDLRSVRHAWPDNGTYTLTLTVSDGTTSARRELRVEVQNGAPAIVGLDVPERAQEGTRIQVETNATDPAGNFDPLSYSWDFGDNSPPSPTFQADHVYADNGTYTITLTVSDDDGGESIETRAIQITNAAPRIQLLNGPERVPEGSPATFLTVAIDVAQDPLAYTWMFENGPTLTGSPEATHTYANDGTFEVVVTVTDDDEGSTSESATLEVFNVAPSILDFGGDFTGQEGDTFSFSARASDPGDDTLTYTWNFGESLETIQGEDLQEINHVYTDAGTYTLSLVVSDGDGGSVQRSRTINVGTAAPTLEALQGPDSGLETLSLNFSASASDPTDQPLTWSWDFGDGSEPLTGEDLSSVEHTWADDGTYILTVTVTDPDGLSASASQSVQIANQAPSITDLTPGTFPEGAPGTISGEANDPAGNRDPLTWTWNWGDGSEPSSGIDLVSATHTYAQSGTYTLTLTVSDGDGGTDTRTVDVVVEDAPPEALSIEGPDEGLEGQSLSFTLLAVDIGGDELNYLWQVGEGDPVDTGANASYTHTFAEDGVYTLTATVIDEEGRAARQTHEITVANQAPTISDLAGRQNSLEGEPVAFFASASDPAGDNDPLTWTWDFGDGSEPVTEEGRNTAEHIFPDNGTYQVRVTVTDDEGDSTESSIQIVVENVAPSILSTPPTLASYGQLYTYPVEIADPGLADTLTLGVIEGPLGMEIVDNTVQWAISARQFVAGGPYSVTIQVTDDEGAFDTQTWDIALDFVDMDGDGAPDLCEIDSGLDPTDPTDADLDPDGDGLSNRDECLQGSDPNTSNAPEAPTLVSPENGERLDTASPTVALVPGADPDNDLLTHTLEIYADEDLTRLVAIVEDNQPGTEALSIALDLELEENAWYWWRARSEDASGESQWSETWRFLVDVDNEPPTAPELLSPVDSADTQSPTLTIGPSEDPEGDGITYLYELYDNENLIGALETGESDELTWALSAELEEDTPYWWRAGARDDLGEMSWAPSITFFVNSQNSLPERPRIISPRPGDLFDALPVELVWEASEDPDGDPLTYEVQVATDLGYSNIVLDRSGVGADEPGAETLSLMLDGLEFNQTYQVRLRAFDEDGAGEYSITSFATFQEDPDAPLPAAVPVSPLSGDLVSADAFELVVENVEDFRALSYTFEVYADPALEQILFVAEDVAEGPNGQTSVLVDTLQGRSGTVYWTAYAKSPQNNVQSPPFEAQAINLATEISPGSVDGNQNDGCACSVPGDSPAQPWTPGLVLATILLGILIRRRA